MHAWEPLLRRVLSRLMQRMALPTGISLDLTSANRIFNRISEEYGVSIQRASYLTSLQIAILGGAPLFWKPLSNRYGRRPIFLTSLVCSLVCNVGCAKSTDYASTAACRALQAFFISPASGKAPRITHISMAGL